MRLLVDIGNTRIKWALDKGAGPEHAQSLIHRGRAPADAVSFIESMDAQVDAIGVVNVGGEALGRALTAAVERRFGLAPRFAVTAARCGEVTNGYLATDQLGTDRWAAIVGAWTEFRTRLCVVDAGTAVTIDLVAENGAHCGGFILPGFDLMAKSLHSDTSDIEGFVKAGDDSLSPGDWLGRDTLTAVQRGAQFALRSAIGAAVRAHGRGSDQPVRLILTGGDAGQVAPAEDIVADIRPDLVLAGLKCLLEAAADA